MFESQLHDGGYVFRGRSADNHLFVGRCLDFDDNQSVLFLCIIMCCYVCVFCLSVFFFKWRSALMQNRDLQWSGQLYVNTQIIKNVLYGIAWE